MSLLSFRWSDQTTILPLTSGLAWAQMAVQTGNSLPVPRSQA